MTLTDRQPDSIDRWNGHNSHTSQLPATAAKRLGDGPYPTPEDWLEPRREADRSLLEAMGKTGSQHDIAAFFTGMYDDQFIHTPGVGWHYWSGIAWHTDRLGHLRDCIRRVAVQLTAGGSLARSAQTARFVSGVEEFLRRDPAHARPDGYFDADPDLLGVAAGYAVDLRTGEVLAPDRERLILRHADHLPIETDGCPRWLRFLHEATDGDDDLIDFLQRWCGYCATGHTRERTLLFVHGPGGTGKTTFAEVLAAVLGDYSDVAPLDTFTQTRGDRHPTDLAGLTGARLVTASETEEGRPWTEAKLKAVTGEDTIKVRFMHKDFFKEKPTWKLLIVGNHLPELRNADTSMSSRFRVVPFTHPPARPNLHLRKTLLAEADGILEWIIEGAQLWYKEGLRTAAVIEATTNAYIAEANLMKRWLNEYAERDPDLSTRAKTLFESWTAWCTDNKHNPGNTTRFGRKLGEIAGLSKHKTGGVNYWRGVTLPDSPKQGQLRDS